jgi:Protein of unknown function (DUF3667)
MSSVAKTSLESLDVHLSPHQETTYCRSCGSEAHGKFCSACGEETEVAVPSAGEFLHEFIGHYVALEGKLLKTLQFLMFRPGKLTLDYLAGRRVSFISPLRLYLTMSLVVFALIKIFGIELPKLTVEGDSFGVAYSHSVNKQTATFYVDIHAKDVDEGSMTASTQQAQPPAQHKILDVANGVLSNINAKWMTNLQKFVSESSAKKGEVLSYGFLAYLPYMLIGALPLFALYLKLIYLGSTRRYGEHLVFALHASAFAFLLASLMIILPGNVAWLALCIYKQLFSLISIWDYIQVVPFLWLIGYLPIAMQKVYGESLFSTAWRWLAVISAHLLAISSLTIMAELIGIVTHG